LLYPTIELDGHLPEKDPRDILQLRADAIIECMQRPGWETASDEVRYESLQRVLLKQTQLEMTRVVLRLLARLQSYWEQPITCNVILPMAAKM
jgi:hypothetical protein